MATTLMLADKAHIYSMVPLGHTKEVRGTFELTDEYAQGLAEAAAKNSGHTKVLRVWHDHKAGGVFAEVE